MNSEAIISVIIPIYNTAKYLDACIESVLNQTYKNYQIILVDDESPDEAPAMCDAWADKCEKIQVIHKKNEGLGLTRDAGIEKAIGRYICFLDSDDTIEPDTFEGCIEALEGRGADACFYGRKTGQPDGTFKIKTNIPDKLEYVGDEVRREYATTYLGSTPEDKGPGYIQVSACCAMYRLEIIKNKNIRFLSERECLSEDTFFNLDFCKYAEKIVIIPKNYYNYTYNGESLTKKYNPNKYNQLKNFYRTLVTYKEFYSDADKVDMRIPYQLYIYLRHIIEYEIRSYEINGMSQTIKRLKEICKDEFIKDTVAQIDYSFLNKKRKLFIDWVIQGKVFRIIGYYLIKK